MARNEHGRATATNKEEAGQTIRGSGNVEDVPNLLISGEDLEGVRCVGLKVAKRPNRGISSRGLSLQNSLANLGLSGPFKEKKK